VGLPLDSPVFTLPLNLQTDMLTTTLQTTKEIKKKDLKARQKKSDVKSFS